MRQYLSNWTGQKDNFHNSNIPLKTKPFSQNSTFQTFGHGLDFPTQSFLRDDLVMPPQPKTIAEIMQME